MRPGRFSAPLTVGFELAGGAGTTNVPSVIRLVQVPPSTAYPRLVVGSGLQLEWPRYINGAPLPARPDGSPDFTGVVGYA